MSHDKLSSCAFIHNLIWYKSLSMYVSLFEERVTELASSKKVYTGKYNLSRNIGSYLILMSDF